MKLVSFAVVRECGLMPASAQVSMSVAMTAQLLLPSSEPTGGQVTLLDHLALGVGACFCSIATPATAFPIHLHYRASDRSVSLGKSRHEAQDVQYPLISRG